MSPLTRFMAKVKKSGKCWLWTAYSHKTGYGRFTFKGKVRNAHRWIYEYTNGTLAQGLYALHRCDNRACVRPDHLFAGTKADNMIDMVNKGRSCRGENRKNHKLKEGDVKEIRNGTMTLRQVCERYGIAHSNAWSVRHGHRWKHVT